MRDSYGRCEFRRRPAASNRWARIRVFAVTLGVLGVLVIPGAVAGTNRGSELADPSLSYFSIKADTSYIIPVLQRARRINPGLKISDRPLERSWMDEIQRDAARELLW